MTRIRNALLLLKEYGFSDKTLEEIYKYETFDSFVNPLFVKNHISYGKYEKILTDKEKKLTKDFMDFSNFSKEFKSKMLEYKKLGVKIYFKYDENFPCYLFPKYKPMFIYCYGNKELLNKNHNKIGIIGTRKPSLKSLEKTKEIVKHYVDKNYITVSGLAKGIDTEVHSETLNCGGKTIAVLPTSFEKIYPKENENLFKKIVSNENGLAITVVGPFGTTYKSNFLDRNSIVASMSNKILLIEANMRSGTISTVNRAREYNKKVLYDSNLLTSDVIMYLSKIGAQDIEGEES